MRLRRVAVSGFKTFARRTEIQLQAGVTAVVGPNGSGKSNLVDAVRWALGETSARELRGARMEEVIHAGGPGRPPLGMAQVDVVIDNEEGRLPVDAAEVEISRRVTRSGESEWRINGRRVRLRDLEQVLGATGLTQNGYAVIAQNDVDGIIEASPAQRRALVEEAAGVRRLRAARDDALARVTGVETALLRLTDLLGDAEPRLAELEGQSALALEQRELSGRLAELRGSLAREAWRAARAQLRRARARLASAAGRSEAAAEAELGYAERLAEARAATVAARTRRVEADRRLEEARLLAERILGEMRRQEDRAEAAALARAGHAREEAEARADAALHSALLEDLRGAGDAAVALLDRLGVQSRTLAAAEAEASSGVAAATAAAEAAARAAAGASAAADRLAVRERDASARIDLLEESARGLVASGAASRRRAAELAAEVEASAASAAAAAARVEAASAAEAAAAAAVTGERERLDAAEARTSAALAEAREAAAHAAALRGQRDGALGGGAVAEAVAAERLRGTRLLEAFAVRDPADAAAIEAALEDHLGAWLVDDLDAAADVLGTEGVREEVIGRSAVPPSAPRPVDEPSARPAGGAVEASGRGGRTVLDDLLRDVWLVPESGAARRIAAAGGVAVLPDGRVLAGRRLRGGGRPGATLALAAAARGAADRAADRAAAAEAAGASAADRRAALDAAAQGLAGARRATEEARAAAAAAAATAAGVDAARRAAEARADALAAELGGRAAAADAARSDREACRRDLAAARAQAESAAADAAAAGALRAEQEARLTAAAAARRAHELVVARAEPEARDVQRRLGAARSAAEDAEQRTRVAELRRCAAEERALAALARGREHRRRVGLASAAVGDAEAAAAAAAAPLAALEAAVDRLEGERGEVAVAAARAADERDAASGEVTALESEVTRLAGALRADDLDEGPEPDAAAADRAEREILRLERRVAALGPVNALAPEQHAALSARVAGLRRDHDDLHGACDDLRALAARLDREIAGRFEAVFGAVAVHFGELFEELFPGGRAALRLEDTPAVASADAGRPVAPRGIEILAQPAGKRLQALSLLSGGERALTALAVILALQLANPSPFSVFDEVDAPLDDANVARFTRLLRRLAERQQFLVVTHNHATMAAADALYGVTMGGDGVSRLLSVRFTEIAARGAVAYPAVAEAAAAS